MHLPNHFVPCRGVEARCLAKTRGIQTPVATEILVRLKFDVQVIRRVHERQEVEFCDCFRGNLVHARKLRPVLQHVGDDAGQRERGKPRVNAAGRTRAPCRRGCRRTSRSGRWRCSVRRPMIEVRNVRQPGPSTSPRNFVCGRRGLRRRRHRLSVYLPLRPEKTQSVLMWIIRAPPARQRFAKRCGKSELIDRLIIGSLAPREAA